MRSRLCPADGAVDDGAGALLDRRGRTGVARRRSLPAMSLPLLGVLAAGILDPQHLIETLGLIGLFGIVFAESGLLIGFFLPGDSLLFTAGFLAYQGTFSLPELCIICAVAAILGDSVGYMFGRRVGRRLFMRPDSTFFKKKHLDAAEAFYE